MRRIETEARNQIAPSLCIGRRESRDAGRGFVEARADAEIGSVTKDAGETVLRGHEAEALIQQRLLVRREEARAREHRQIHRAEIMTKARQRELLGFDRATRRLFAFDHRHGPSFFGESKGRGEAIVAGSDHHRVIRHLGAFPLKVPTPRRWEIPCVSKHSSREARSKRPVTLQFLCSKMSHKGGDRNTLCIILGRELLERMRPPDCCKIIFLPLI